MVRRNFLSGPQRKKNTLVIHRISYQIISLSSIEHRLNKLFYKKKSKQQFQAGYVRYQTDQRFCLN